MAAVATSRRSAGRAASPSAQRMQESIDHSLIWRQEYERIWRISEDWYRGNVRQYMYSHLADDQHLYGGESRDGPRNTYVAVNECKGVAEQYQARTLMRNPKIYAYPRFPGAAGYAKSVVTLLNYFWREQRVNDAFGLSTRDSIIIGHGWVRTNWKRDYSTRAVPKAEVDAEIARMVQIRESARALNPEADYPDDATIERTVRAEFRRHPRLMSWSDHPVARYVNPVDVVVDPAATCMDDARWIAQRTYVTRDEIGDDSDLEPKGRSEALNRLTGSSSAYPGRGTRAGIASGRARTSYGPTERRTPGVDWIEVWEFHDLTAGTWCRFAWDADHWLIAPRPSPFAGSRFRSPFEMIRNHEVKATDMTRDFYPQGDIEQIVLINWELNETRTELMKHRRQMSPMWLTRSRALSREQRTQLAHPAAGRVFTVDGNDSLDQQIRPLQAGAINPQLFDVVGQSRYDLARVAGVSDLDRGVAEVERRSATEAGLLGDATSSRIEERIIKTQAAAARVAHRMLILCQLYLTAPQVARVTGEKGAVEWVQFDRERIQGTYDVEIEHGSMAPRNDAQRRRDSIALLQALGPFAQNGNVDLAPLIRFVLESFDVDDPDEFMPQPQSETQPATTMQAQTGIMQP